MIEKKIEYLVNWLRQMKEKAGAKGFVVGVSGGIDSAVVLNLCMKADPKNTLGVILPCYSNPDSAAHALEVLEAAHANYTSVNLEDAHEAVFGPVKRNLERQGSWNTETQVMTNGNLRARLRMCALYTIANNLGYLVVGTDNAPETLVGYFTKWGDGAIDLVPIVNETKRQVRELGRALGVPEIVIIKAPTADLFAGQTDEEEMGVTYDHLDDYIEGKPVPAEVRAKIEKMHAVTQHKRTGSIGPAPLDSFRMASR